MALRIHLRAVLEILFAGTCILCLVLLWRVQHSDGMVCLFRSWFWLHADRGAGLSLAALAALLAWYGVRSGAWFAGRRAAVYAGKLAMLGLSLWLCFAVGERVYRGHLSRTRGFNLFQDFQNFQEGKAVNIQNPHGLAVLTYLVSDPILIYDMRPGQDRPFGQQRLVTNRIGMRDRDYPVAKPPGVLRIVGIGDSGMFGWGVEEEECFLGVLERNLAERGGRKVEVLNLSVPGYNTSQEVRMLEYKGLQFKPDIVILHWCMNDYMLPFFLYKAPDLDRMDVNFLLTSIFHRQKLNELVRPRPMTYMDIEKSKVDPLLVESSGPEGVRRSLARLQQLSLEHGFEVMVFGPMGDQVLGMCRELGFVAHNVFEEFSREAYPPEEYAIYEMHPLAKGHRVLGEHLEIWLREAGWLDQGADE